MPLMIADPRATVLAMLPMRAVGVEIGVWKAAYSRQILAIARPKTLHLVDPWKVSTEPDRANAWYGEGKVTQGDMDAIHDKVAAGFAEQIESGQVVIHRGFSADVLAGFENDSVDYVYVDGDHSYAGCKADLEAAVRIVRPGGLICADDYSTGKWWKDDIVRAVNEIAAEHVLKFRFVSGNQIVMRKPGGNLGEAGGTKRGGRRRRMAQEAAED